MPRAEPEPEVEYPETYHKETKDSTRRAWASCDRFVNQAPDSFDHWLAARGFDMAPCRLRTRNGIHRFAVKEGVENRAKEYRNEIAADLKKQKWLRMSPQIAKELSWRMLDMKMPELIASASKVKEVVVPVEVMQESVDGMEFLPEWMRWVILHPGLAFETEQINDDVDLQARIRAYEEQYPVPNQASRNMFYVMRGDGKKLENLFKECAKIHADAVKRTDATEGTEDAAEMASIEELESLFGSTEE